MKPWEKYGDEQQGAGPWEKFKPQQGTNQDQHGVVSAIKNIPKSAAEYGKSLVDVAMHPKQSAETLGRVMSGGVQAAIASGNENEDTRAFNRLIDTFKDRYGSFENFKQTLINDPVGVAGDLSAVLMGAGTIAKGAGIASKARTLQRVGSTVQKIGANVEPISATMNIAGKTAGKLIPKKTIRKMYEGAAKYRTVLSTAERERLTNTALKYDILPSVKGVSKIQDIIDDINSKIGTQIDATTAKAIINQATGAAPDPRLMPINELFKDFSALRDEALRISSEPTKELAQINNIEKNLRRANEIIGRRELMPLEAQRIKQRTYRDIARYYDRIQKSPANVEARKAVARAAKEYLEDIIPEIKQLNAQEGSLIELREALQRSANRITNRDLIGIGAPIKGAAGAAAAGVPGAAAGIILGVLDTPSVKSRLAVALNKLKKRGIKITASGAAVRLGLVNLEEQVERGMMPKRTTVVPIRDVGTIQNFDLQNQMKEPRQ